MAEKARLAEDPFWSAIAGGALLIEAWESPGGSSHTPDAPLSVTAASFSAPPRKFPVANSASPAEVGRHSQGAGGFPSAGPNACARTSEGVAH
jgi:hypothetical protein